MMANAVIQKYLSQPVHNYQEGRVLFEQFSDDDVLKVLFRTGSSSYHHRRLLAALRELSTKENVAAVNKKVEKIPKKTIPDLLEFDIPVKPYKEDEYQSFPERIQEVVRKKNMHYKRAQQLFIQIGFTEDKDMRLEMALVLLADHEQVNACWAIIDEYRETGKVMVEKSISIQEEIDAIVDVKLLKSLNNVRANISKDKKKLEALPDGHRKAKVMLRYQSNLLKQELLLKRIGGLDE